MSDSTMKIVILGATTGFGAAMASEGLMRGFEVVCVTRSPKEVMNAHKNVKNLSAVQVDPLNSKKLKEIFHGADAVVFGLNVDYADWDPFMIDALGATLEALADLERKPALLFPGNIYALGPQTGAPFAEDAANNPSTKKGWVRYKLEGMLKNAVDTGQPVLILRLADFFGPTVRNGLMDRIFGNAAEGKPIMLIGSAKTAHQLTYIPDAARISFELLGQDREAGLTIVNAPTHDISSFSAFSESVARLAGHPTLKQKKLPWFMVKMFGMFVRQFREMSELEYLFEDGVMLDNRTLKILLPDISMTPMDTAIKESIQSYECQNLPVFDAD